MISTPSSGRKVLMIRSSNRRRWLNRFLAERNFIDNLRSGSPLRLGPQGRYQREDCEEEQDSLDGRHPRGRDGSRIGLAESEALQLPDETTIAHATRHTPCGREEAL